MERKEILRSDVPLGMHSKSSRIQRKKRSSHKSRKSRHKKRQHKGKKKKKATHQNKLRTLSSRSSRSSSGSVITFDHITRGERKSGGPMSPRATVEKLAVLSKSSRKMVQRKSDEKKKKQHYERVDESIIRQRALNTLRPQLEQLKYSKSNLALAKITINACMTLNFSLLEPYIDEEDDQKLKVMQRVSSLFVEACNDEYYEILRVLELQNKKLNNEIDAMNSRLMKIAKNVEAEQRTISIDVESGQITLEEFAAIEEEKDVEVERAIKELLAIGEEK